MKQVWSWNQGEGADVLLCWFPSYSNRFLKRWWYTTERERKRTKDDMDLGALQNVFNLIKNRHLEWIVSYMEECDKTYFVN